MTHALLLRRSCCRTSEPLIEPSCVKESDEDTPTEDASQEKTEQTTVTAKMNAVICSFFIFWAWGTDCVLSARVTGRPPAAFSSSSTGWM
jgi:hypothetical protein